MSAHRSKASLQLIAWFGLLLAFVGFSDVPEARGHGAEEHASGHHGGQIVGTVVASEPAALSVRTVSGETIRIRTTPDTRIATQNGPAAISSVESGTRVAIRLKDGEGPPTADEIRVGSK